MITLDVLVLTAKTSLGNTSKTLNSIFFRQGSNLIIGIGLVMEKVIRSRLQKLIKQNLHKRVIAATIIDLRTWFLTQLDHNTKWNVRKKWKSLQTLMIKNFMIY
jgi:hypothetical protein